MTLRTISVFVLAAGVFCADAQAQNVMETAGSNIAVTQCYPHQHAPGYPGHPWVDPYGNRRGVEGFPVSDGFLDIAYANQARIAAREIDFGLVSRGRLIALARDAGTFAPGARIDHEFSLDPQVFPIGTALPFCAVLRVKYADGTEWINPAPPPL